MQKFNTIKVSQFKKLYKQGESRARWTCEGKTGYIHFGKVEASFGMRHYFICSLCGEYREKLTFNGDIFACFRCFGVNLYAGIQATTRGGSEFIAYKMQRLAAKNRVEDLKFPFNFYQYERPYRYNQDRWSRALLILQALESMRNQSIFYEKVYDVKIIKSVERGEHKAVQSPYTPYFHLINFYSFDGKPIPKKLNF